MCEIASSLSFICRAYLKIPEMFIDQATGSNDTKDTWYKLISISEYNTKEWSFKSL